MAVCTHRNGIGNTTDGTSFTLSAGATVPRGGELLVCFVVLMADTSTDWVLTDNQTGGTYTKVRRQVKNTSLDFMELWVRDTLFNSATAPTFTFSHAAGVGTGCAVMCCGVSDMKATGAAAVRNQGGQDNQPALGTPAVTFDSGGVTLAKNPTLGATCNGTNPSGGSVPTGWTSQFNSGFATPTTGERYCTRDSGFEGTTITWAGTQATAFCSMAIELDAAEPVRVPVNLPFVAR